MFENGILRKLSVLIIIINYYYYYYQLLYIIESLLDVYDVGGGIGLGVG